MKIANYIYEDQSQLGIVNEAETHLWPLAKALPAPLSEDMLALMKAYPQGLPQEVLAQAAQAPKEELLPLSAVTLKAPLTRPIHDIICVGVNYVSHIPESTIGLKDSKLKEKPKETVFFGKRAIAITGHQEPVVNAWDLDDHLDYEVELAVVIGKGGRNILPEEARQHIFGYAVFNDISARKTQKGRIQWLLGKGMDTFACMGPYLVTADAVEFPPELELMSRVNGQERQHANTRMLIRDIPTLIAEVSAYTTLEPGDILATGTPAGVAMGMEEPLWLKPGDVVECEIEGIGILRNPIR